MATKASALDLFIGRKFAIDALIARIAELSDEHFGCNPDDINYGHAGSLEHACEQLAQVVRWMEQLAGVYEEV